MSFATSTPVKIDPTAPDIAGDFAPNFVPLKGVVYDKDKKTISDATIKMEVISKLDRGGCTLAQTKTDSFGNYSFTDTLYNTKIKLTLSKVGYKEVSRTENINDRKLPLALFSIIDFGGANPKDANYFLEKI